LHQAKAEQTGTSDSLCFGAFVNLRSFTCLFSAGAQVKAGESIAMLRLANGRDVPYPDPIPRSFDCVVEELFVSNNQLVFAGTPLARVVRLDLEPTRFFS
jgi:hypothetical protein